MELLATLLILQALISGGLAAFVADKKGYKAGSWFACGFFFGILGLIAAAGLPGKKLEDRNEVFRKKCPDCAEYIRKEALVCRYCGAKFDRDQVEEELIRAWEDLVCSDAGSKTIEKAAAAAVAVAGPVRLADLIDRLWNSSRFDGAENLIADAVFSIGPAAIPCLERRRGEKDEATDILIERIVALIKSSRQDKA